MIYRVIKTFTDMQDNNRKYSVGDIFPRTGLSVTQKRLEELLTDKNRRGIPMIVAESDEVKTEEPAEVKEEKPKRTTKPRATGKKKNVK